MLMLRLAFMKAIATFWESLHNSAPSKKQKSHLRPCWYDSDGSDVCWYSLWHYKRHVTDTATRTSWSATAVSWLSHLVDNIPETCWWQHPQSIIQKIQILPNYIQKRRGYIFHCKMIRQMYRATHYHGEKINFSDNNIFYVRLIVTNFKWHCLVCEWYSNKRDIQPWLQW